MLEINIENENGKTWKNMLHRLGWYSVAIWFGASILSQALYMGTYGRPYGPEELLEPLGAFYWVLVAIELLFWLILGLLIMIKLYSTTNLQNPMEKTHHSA